MMHCAFISSKKGLWANYQTLHKLTFCVCQTSVLYATLLYFWVLALILLSDEETAGGSCDDYPKVDSAWHGDIDSDADSVDSEEEDPLKWERACFFSHFFFVGGGISLGYKPIFGPPRDLNLLLLPISPPPFINVASMQNHTQISDLRGTALH